MMGDDYTYRTSDLTRVPGHRATEPALFSLFEAVRKRDSREKEFDPASLTDEKKATYLESIRDELALRGRALKFQVFEIGQLMCEAKRVLPHGQFKPWIADNFEHGYRTAHNCMRVYVACAGHTQMVEYFQPSCLYVLCQPNFPDDLRTALFENTKGPVDIKQKEIVELGLRYKKGEIGIDDDRIQSLLKHEVKQNFDAKLAIELKALHDLVKARRARIAALFDRSPSHPLIKDNGGRVRDETSILKRIERFETMLNNGIERLKSANLA